MPDNSKYIASRQMKRHVADDCLPPITEGQLVRRQDHERCLSGQPVTVDAMMTHIMAQVALTPRSRLAVLSSVKLNPGRVRPEMALECINFSSRGHPPQMRITTCLAGILAHGHRVMRLPSRVSPVACLTPLPHTVAGTAPDLRPDGYSSPGSLLQPWPLASGIQACSLKLICNCPSTSYGSWHGD